MSKISIEGNASGTGTLTIAAPNTNSNYTLTLPAETGTVLTSGGAIDVNASAPADSLAISSAGNVGIGTSSPSLLLSIGSSSKRGLAGVVGDSTSVGSPRFTLDNSSATSGKNWGLYSGNTAVGNFDISNITDGVTALTIDNSSNLKFNSGYGSVATAYGCRAWVNFNGTGTVAIRASGNVSSITDNGTGDYTVNFSTALPDNYYAVACTTLEYGSTGGTDWDCAPKRQLNYSDTFSSSSITVQCFTGSYVAVDSGLVNVSVFR